MSERLLIIGGVAAGMSAAAKARRVDPALDIVVYEQSGYVSVGACGLPYVIKGEIAQATDVVVRTPEQFARQGIQALVRHRVLAIEPASQTLRVQNLDSGHEFDDRWDKLILTTGGAATRPPLPGIGLPGVFTLRTVEDAVAIQQWLAHVQPRTGVVVGGGYIGLELAEALAAHGITLTLVEQAPQVLTLLDAELAALVQAELEQQGVALRLGQAISSLEGDERVRGVMVGDELIPAEIVVVGAGVRPNVGLATAAGVILGPTGAVAVDNQQRTNIAGIWAAGDVAEAFHRVTGRPAYVPLGTTANKQGKVAGTNAAGGEATFDGIVGTAAVKVFDLQIAMTGLSERRAGEEGFAATSVTATAGARAHYMPEHPPITVKLVFEQGSKRLLGAQLVGREGVPKRVDVVAAALQAGWTVDDLAALDLSYAPPFAPVWDPLLVAANLASR